MGSPRITWRSIESWFHGLNLVQQFALAGSIVVLVAMTVMGRLVASQIEVGVVNSTSAATALYMDAVLAPIVGRLTQGKKLDASSSERIDQLLAKTESGQKIISIKVWDRNGVITFSNQEQLIGKKFTPSKHLKQAWAGNVSAEFDSLHDEEDAVERSSGLQLLEMYMPVRDAANGDIVAVAEFYVLADALNRDLAAARKQSWLVVGFISLLMMSALFGIVRKGSRTINQQRRSLEERLRQNEQLRKHVQRAYRRTEHLKERFLRKVGADLHDGPAQLIGLALLRLDSLRPGSRLTSSEVAENQALDSVRDNLKEALEEIRRQSAGLALPELEAANSREAIELAIAGHERRTNTTVTSRIEMPALAVGEEVKICLYRFVQEGLNYAFRHANGVGQKVEATVMNSNLIVSVMDKGMGLERNSQSDHHQGIGLAALRDRVEALGGQFSFIAKQDRGASLEAVFSIDRLSNPDG